MNSIFFVLLLSAAISESDLRQSILKHTADFEKDLLKIKATLDTGLKEDADQRQTGLAIESIQEPGEDGLHHAIVVFVIDNSPADKAGIEPGDRIISVGPRRIEHETNEIIDDLMTGEGDSAKVVIYRMSEKIYYEKKVKRKKLSCLARSVKKIKYKEWHESLDRLQKINGSAKAVAINPGSNKSDLVEVYQHMVDLAVMKLKLAELIFADYIRSAVATCNIRFEPRKKNKK